MTRPHSANFATSVDEQLASALLFPSAAMQPDVHQRFDLSDVEVSSPKPVRRVVERQDTVDGELDELVEELTTVYRRAS